MFLLHLFLRGFSQHFHGDISFFNGITLKLLSVTILMIKSIVKWYDLTFLLLYWKPIIGKMLMLTVIYTTPSTRHVSMQTYADDRLTFCLSTCQSYNVSSVFLYYVHRTYEILFSWVLLLHRSILKDVYSLLILIW
jgi:hypothetical protein